MTNQVLLLTLLSSNFQNATLFMTTKNGEKSIPPPRRMALGSTHSSRDRSPGRIQLFASPRILDWKSARSRRRRTTTTLSGTRSAWQAEREKKGGCHDGDI